MTSPLYDTIGVAYATQRRTDPRIAAQLHAALAGATRLVNIGAGAGSYEPEDIELIAVEPSTQMIAQRPATAHPVVQARAEDLPFEDDSFSHAMTVLSMHHWGDRARAFAHINRVTTRRFVAITCDPHARPFWLVRDYFPEIYEEDLRIFPPLDEFHTHFDDVVITPLMVPHDCVDGFLAAYWRRPHAYLREEVRAASSTFAKLPQVERGVERLRRDLEDGSWQEKNRELLDATEFDAGYRLVTATVRKTRP